MCLKPKNWPKFFLDLETMNEESWEISKKSNDYLKIPTKQAIIVM